VTNKVTSYVDRKHNWLAVSLSGCGDSRRNSQLRSWPSNNYSDANNREQRSSSNRNFRVEEPNEDMVNSDHSSNRRVSNDKRNPRGHQPLPCESYHDSTGEPMNQATFEQRLEHQLGYYLSDDNLPFDLLTIKHKDKDDWVDVPYLIAAPKVKQLITDYATELCHKVLQNHPALEYSKCNGEAYVRRKQPLPPHLDNEALRTWEDQDSRPPFVIKRDRGYSRLDNELSSQPHRRSHEFSSTQRSDSHSRPQFRNTLTSFHNRRSGGESHEPRRSSSSTGRNDHGGYNRHSLNSSRHQNRDR
jgi:hypothetical protein